MIYYCMPNDKEERPITYTEQERPPAVLLHGTTHARFITFMQPDGSYKDPDKQPIWLDEEIIRPLKLARYYQDVHTNEAVLLIVRSDMLSLQKPKNAKKSFPEQLTLPKIWTTQQLPPYSFGAYSIVRDLQLQYGISTKDYIERVIDTCEPLIKEPDYIKQFSKK